MITAVCPNPQCGRALKMEERFVGKRVKCVHCHQPFLVQVLPADDATSPAAPGTPWLGDWGTNDTAVGGPETAARPPNGPPPLPPRPQPVGAGLRVGPLIVSLVSLAVIAGSLAGITSILRSPADGTAEAAGAGVAAQRWAAVAIESGGVRLIIIDGKKLPGGAEVAPVYSMNRDWNVAEPTAIADLEKILAGYHKELEEYKVPAERRLVACNSAVLGSDRARQLAAFEAAARKTLRRGVEVVEAAEEAEYGARGSVPPKFRGKSVSLDVGSGQTRFGYFDTPKTFKGGELDIGTKGAQTEITKLMARPGRGSFSAAGREWRPRADAAVSRLTETMPPLVNHERFYLLGGTAWAVTVLSHPEEFAKPSGERPADVRVTPSDIDAVLKLIEQHGDFNAVKAAVVAKVPAGAGRDRAAEEVSSVGKIKLERIAAGAYLLQSFAEVCKFESKQVRFFVRSLHAWPIGYILVKGEFDK